MAFETEEEQVAQVVEISAAVVRAVAQLPPSPGDFRTRFPQRQPAAARFVAEQLSDQGDVAVEFSERLAAGVWAIYERAVGAELPVLRREALEALEPAARLLVQGVKERHGDEPFDPEWLVELPREPQPHVMGFIIGALRASRLRLDGTQVLAIAGAVLALAGALEAASWRRRNGATEGASRSN